MFQIISYVSTSTPNLTDSDIYDLLNFVEEENNKNNVSGILMYSDGNFFQVIEGEKTILNNLFQNIKNDIRHKDVIKIFEREIYNKSFKKYNSSFVTSIGDSYNNKELKKFLAEEKQRNPDNYKSISYLAHKFLNLN